MYVRGLGYQKLLGELCVAHGSASIFVDGNGLALVALSPMPDKNQYPKADVRFRRVVESRLTITGSASAKKRPRHL